MKGTEPITWTNDFESNQCIIPRHTLPLKQVVGALGIAFGFLLSSGPLALTLFLLLAPPDVAKQDSNFLSFALFPLVIPGAVCFPLTLILWQRSLLSMFGQTSIVIDHRYLSVVRVAGPIWSRRKIPLEQLAGFRVEEAPGLGRTGTLQSLMVIKENGRSPCILRAYPREMVSQLAKELPTQVMQAVTRSRSSPAEPLPVELVSPNPFALDERSDRPLGSRIMIVDHHNEFRVEMPRKRFLEATSPFARLWLSGWLLSQLFIWLGLVPALLAGRVQGEPSAGWVLAVVFTAVTIAIAAYYSSILSREGTVRVTQQKVNFRDQSLWSDHQAEWRTDAIHDVFVGVDRSDTEDGPVFSHHIEVKPDNHPPRCWFDNRDKEELEWIATLINQRLTDIQNESDR